MKVFLRTYGCRANQYDTEALRGFLLAADVEVTASEEEADAAVFNSCSVTAAAEVDLRRDIRHLAHRNSSVRTVVMGCAAGLPVRDETSAPLRTLPTVVGIVPGGDVAAVAAALALPCSEAGGLAAIQTGARALLRVQDGCDEHCTFCAATLARGANRSRSVADLVTEATALSEAHPEIVITGLHIGSYGRDIGTSLGALVSQLIQRVPRVRFRLSSIEATEVDSALVRLMRDEPMRLAPHVHAPLQSGSDTILRRMGRHWYSAASYADAVEILTAGLPVFGLSADVIAGFPGETDADHAATIRLVERLPFTSLHVFPYSPRPGAAATRLPAAVRPAVIRDRAAELRAAGEAKSAAYARSRCNGTADVVTVSRGAGLTEDYLSVTVPDMTIARRSRFPARLIPGERRLAASPVETLTR